MKSTMDRVPAWLALMTAAILTFTFTACSDDEDIENEVTYTYVFTEISASHPDFLEEKGKIENAFKSALGATGSNFTKRGTVEECDKQVYAGCEREYSKELYQFCQEDIPRLPRCTIRGVDMH